MGKGVKMNKEILFRGKRVDNDEWTFGDLIVSKNKYYIHPQGNSFQVDGVLSRLIVLHEVKSETVGQYTGLTDKNGKKIFEGDIVKCLSLEYGYVNKEVYYTEGKAKFGLSSCGTDYEFGEYIDVEVIGNIYDNPELLEK
jgi:uncharacterized phage protein (TIGR01671 family)